MQKRVYFVLGMLTSAVLIYMLIQKRWSQWAQAQTYEAGVRDFNAQAAEDRAARRANMTPEQKIRLEMMKQEYRMQALEELDEEEEKKRHGKKKTGD